MSVILVHLDKQIESARRLLGIVIEQSAAILLERLAALTVADRQRLQEFGRLAQCRLKLGNSER